MLSHVTASFWEEEEKGRRLVLWSIIRHFYTRNNVETIHLDPITVRPSLKLKMHTKVGVKLPSNVIKRIIGHLLSLFCENSKRPQQPQNWYLFRFLSHFLKIHPKNWVFKNSSNWTDTRLNSANGFNFWRENRPEIWETWSHSLNCQNPLPNKLRSLFGFPLSARHFLFQFRRKFGYFGYFRHFRDFWVLSAGVCCYDIHARVCWSFCAP